ncbi:MAG: DUF2070 family protein [Candidatus Jordarchaeales archaeon]
MSLRLENIARLYNKLFTLPSSPLLLSLDILVHAALGALFFLLMVPLHGLTVVMDGVAWGLTSLLPASAASCLLSYIVIGREGVKTLNLRRLTGLAMFSTFFWGVPAVLGVALRSWVPAAASLGLAFGVALMSFARMLTIEGVLPLSFARSFAASLTHPLLLIAFLFFSKLVPLSISLAGKLVVVCVTFTLLAHFYLLLIDEAVRQELGIGGLRLLRGFMAEWLSDNPQLLEEALAEIGSVEEHKVLVLSFTHRDDVAASLIVPMVHPGPFRKVGGATLPYMVSKLFEERVGGVAGVAHGASTHAQNPVSRSESVKLAEEVIRETLSGNFKLGVPVSPLVQASRGGVRVGCQLFGELALFTVSLKPCGYDDVHPSVLAELSRELAGEWGGEFFLVDAHSASPGLLELDPLTPESELTREIIDAAREALREAKRLALHSKVRVGGGRASVGNFGVKEGVASGGVFSLIVEVGGSFACYVIVDGNNMVPGLREEVERRVKGLGIQAVEVMTSDSHEANAVSLSERGSNPIGLSVPWDAVFEAVLESVEAAKHQLKEAEPKYFIKEVALKVIGESSMEKLSRSIRNAALLARRAIIIPILSLLGVFLLAF